jgi:hypothetical protein
MFDDSFDSNVEIGDLDFEDDYRYEYEYGTYVLKVIRDDDVFLGHTPKYILYPPFSALAPHDA